MGKRASRWRNGRKVRLGVPMYSLRDVERRPVLGSFKRIEDCIVPAFKSNFQASFSATVRGLLAERFHGSAFGTFGGPG